MDSVKAVQILSEAKSFKIENTAIVQICDPEAIDAFNFAVEILKQQVEIPVFDTEEIVPDCTVHIWSNSQTGECSVAWEKNK